MESDKLEIKANCPTCNREVKFQIPKVLLRDSMDGMLKVQIPKGTCCPDHAFLVYVNQKGRVKGYSGADIEMSNSITAGALKLNKDKMEVTLSQVINMLGTDIVTLMFRAIIINRPVYFIDDFDVLDYTEKILSFLDDLSSENLSIVSKKITLEGLKSKQVRKLEPLAINTAYRAILWSPFINTVDSRLERHVMKGILGIPDTGGQIISLRHEIIKIRKAIVKFIEFLRENAVFEEDVPQIMKNRFNLDITGKHLISLTQIIAFIESPKILKNMKSKIVEVLL
ncbi:MAG: hypothetical protein ACTSUE_00820 [Promethearchaeota archaeon]